MEYVDKYYLKYKNLTDLKCKRNGVLIDNQFLLNHDVKAVLYDEEYNEVLFSINNIQTLYLYPLTLIDYYKNRKRKSPIMLHILETDENIDYLKYIKSLKKIKAVELKINKPISKNIINLLEYLNNNNILVSINLENTNININNIIDYINCFRIKLPKSLNIEKINNFIFKVREINQKRNDATAILIKGYLAEGDAQYYKLLYDLLEKFKVNVIQISKELIPLDSKNISVSKDTQNIVRNLEKYSTNRRTKFISVKDISTLYYPRFHLDERNSRHCYACKLKPCLVGGRLFPCKSYRIINEKLYVKDINEDKINNYEFGEICSDCACIFENDLLYKLDNLNGNFVLEVME